MIKSVVLCLFLLTLLVQGVSLFSPASASMLVEHEQKKQQKNYMQLNRDPLNPNRLIDPEEECQILTSEDSPPRDIRGGHAVYRNLIIPAGYIVVVRKKDGVSSWIRACGNDDVTATEWRPRGELICTPEPEESAPQKPTESTKVDRERGDVYVTQTVTPAPQVEYRDRVVKEKGHPIRDAIVSGAIGFGLGMLFGRFALGGRTRTRTVVVKSGGGPQKDPGNRP